MLSYQMPSINSVRRKMNMLKMVLIGTLTWKFCSSLYKKTFTRRSLQEGHLFSSVQSCLTLCDPMGCRMPGFPVLHYLPEFAQTRVHWITGTVSLLIVNQNKYMTILMRNGRPGMLLMDWQMGRISDYSRNKKPLDKSRQWSVYV